MDIEEQLTDLDLDDGEAFVDPNNTLKYLSGKISFQEYSDFIEKGVEKEQNDVSDVASSSQSMQDSSTPSKASEASTRGRRKRGLPKLLQGLMGEANIRYTRGEFDDALTMCMEVIRMAPNAWDPFETLAMIYDDLGEMEKSLQFNLVAAHLKQSDAGKWCDVAELCVVQGNMPHGLMCLEKASKLMPENENLWLKRAELLEKNNEHKKALDCYKHILTIIPASNGYRFIVLAREVAEKHQSRKEDDRALETMLMAFQKFPNFISDDDVNILLQLYFAKGIYDKSLDILVRHSGVCLYDQDGNSISNISEDVALRENQHDVNAVQCVANNEIPVVLRTKLIVCLINLRYPVCISDLLLPLLETDANENGDLYLDVAEAYMKQGKYAEAKPLLQAVVSSQTFNLAAVWLRYAECFTALSELDDAIVAYTRVVEMQPGLYEARVSLSALYQQQGKKNEALNALRLTDQQAENEDKLLHIRLAMLSSRLLYRQERFRDFIETAKYVLFSLCKDSIETWKQENALPHNRMWKSRARILRYLSKFQFDDNIETVEIDPQKLSSLTEDMWDLYMKLCQVLVAEKMFELLEKVSVMALVCPLFVFDLSKREELDCICFFACARNQNGNFAYSFIREYCAGNLTNNRAWNTFCQIMSMFEDLRHTKFCLRLAVKHPNNYALFLLNGHNSLHAGTYKHALSEYVSALRLNASDPLLNLLIGITYIHLSAQKFSTKRHLLMAQGCAFLNQYLELRGECQETYYNLGRAMQQIGLFSSAIEYYEKALTFSSAVSDPESETFDLTKEIAYNLNLIYIRSGSYDLARYISQTYLVI